MSSAPPSPAAAPADRHIARLHIAGGDDSAGPLARERLQAIADLEQHAFFRPQNGGGGPYDVTLGLEGPHLVFQVCDAGGTALPAHAFSLTPYRGLVRDYFLMIDSYEQARRAAPPEKLQAIDMGRRGMHDEGAALLRARLAHHIEIDHDTARRFFTLICTLMRGVA